MARLAVVASAFLVSGCAPEACDATRPLPDFAASFRGMYPVASLHGRQSVYIRGMAPPVAVEVDGQSAGEVTVTTDADGSVQWFIPPASLTAGYHEVRFLRGADGATASDATFFHAEGIYGWGNKYFTLEDDFVTRCSERYPTEDGNRHVCVGLPWEAGTGERGGRIVVNEIRRDPQNPVLLHWSAAVAGFASFGFSDVAIDPGDANMPPSFVAFSTWDGGVPGLFVWDEWERHPAMLVGGQPTLWSPGEVVLTQLGQFSTPDELGTDEVIQRPPCGIALWRGPQGVFLVISTQSNERLVAGTWDGRAMSLGPLRKVPLNSSGIEACAGITARDLVDDGTGTDELVLMPLTLVGMTVLHGNPIDGFARWPGMPLLEVAASQTRPSIIDLDLDGRLDLLATTGLGTLAAPVGFGTVDILLQRALPDGGIQWEHRPEVIPRTAVSGPVTAFRAHPQDEHAWVILGECALRRAEGINCAFKVDPDLTATPAGYIIGGGFIGGIIIENDPVFPYDADGDGFTDLVESQAEPRAMFWRRPDHEAEDGLYGPREPERLVVDGGVRFVPFDGAPRVLWPPSDAGP